MPAPLANMISSIYAGFREGPLTLVNIAEVNAQICVAGGCLTLRGRGIVSSVSVGNKAEQEKYLTSRGRGIVSSASVGNKAEQEKYLTLGGRDIVLSAFDYDFTPPTIFHPKNE